MQGLNLTYEALAKTRNEAAVDVLLAALSDESDDTRRRALTAIISRSEPKSAQQVLAHWDLLQADDLRVLRPKKKWLAPAVESMLKEGGDDVSVAIEAATALGITTVMDHLVSLAESSGSRQLRQTATDAVIDLVQPLGHDARLDRGQPTVRGPVLARLADSVRRFSMHKNEQLVDALLLVVTWGDADFRQLIGEKSDQFELICKRLRHSHYPGINDLVAGFLRRRRIPEPISAIIRQREQVEFRDALLRTIGSDPSATIVRNLGDIGVPVSCRGGESLVQEVPPEYRAAVAHLYTAADTDELRKLNIVTDTVLRGGPGCESAASSCFARCEVPSIEIWMRAAVTIADGNEAGIARDENSRLLTRLIDLLDHSDPALVRSVRRILQPLHAEEMLYRFDSLRPRTRRKLGRVVMRVDPDALDRIRDALRHPVLKNRLAAIATADAFAAVDLLSDSFRHISREDHQEARIRAAKVMSNAESEDTLTMLREMVQLPESPVRDAAVEALQKREQALQDRRQAVTFTASHAQGD
jgi:hypothetical protein